MASPPNARASRSARRPGTSGCWRCSPGRGWCASASEGGRVWLAAAALAIAFIGVAAINDSEFAYWAQYNTLPPDRGRLDVVIAAGALGLVLLASWLDTGRALRRRVVMGDWLARVTARPGGGSG